LGSVFAGGVNGDIALLKDVNKDLILEDIPPIQYNLVEVYWQKKFGKKKYTK